MVPDAADASHPVIQDASARLHSLTPPQHELLGLLLQGYAPEEIARCRHMSTRTVRNHLQGLYAALGVHTERDAISLAIAAGRQRGFGGWLMTRDARHGPLCDTQHPPASDRLREP